MRRAIPRPFVLVVAAVLGVSLRLPAQAQTSCSQAPITCPDPFGMDTYVRINLEPDGDTCRFNPRTVDDLTLDLGDDVTWDFCNACPTNMTVQLDTTDLSGPFDKFQLFSPPPDASNQVTVNVPCHDWEAAQGTNAQDGGDWRYSLRAKPTGTASFPDEIDPRLEIDDPVFVRWVERGVVLALGLLVGFALSRRRLS